MALSFLRGMSIKKKLVITYVLVVTVIVTIFSIFYYINSRSINMEKAVSRYENSTDQMYGKLQTGFSSYGKYAYLIAQNPSLVNLLTSTPDIYETVYLLNAFIEPNIYFYKNSFDLIDSIRVYTDLDKNAVPSALFYDNEDIKAADWYQATSRQYGAYWRFSGGRLLVSNRIQSLYNTSTIGIVEIEINHRRLFETVSEDEPDIQMAVAYQGENDLIYPADPEPGLRSFIGSAQSDPQPGKGDGRYVLIGRFPLLDTGLSVYFYIHKDRISLNTFSLMFPGLVISLVCILVSGILILIFSRHISRRIDVIIDSVNDIDKDNFSINLPVNTQDELGLLSKCLNRMSSKIQSLIEEIYEAKDKERMAEISALQAKMNPHFLYNIMDTINWVAPEGDSELICRITNHLATYYRTNLNHGRIYTTVANELDNIMAYISLQLLMYEYKFDVEYDIDRSVLELKTVSFILQPLVENAIQHSLSLLEDKKGLLLVRACREDGLLHLSVTDNGLGMDQARAYEILSSKSKGYGLRNVHERIQLAFGPEYGVYIKSSPGEGTEVSILLPACPADRDDPEVYF